MILILNGYDCLGLSLQQYFTSNKIDYIALNSSMLMKKLSVIQQQQHSYWCYNKHKFLISDIKSVYVGASEYSRISSLGKFFDDFYLYNSWNAYLNYILVQISNKIGIYKHDLWTGTLLQLPFFYQYANKFSLSHPELYYSQSNCHMLSSPGSFLYVSQLSGYGWSIFSNQYQGEYIKVTEHRGVRGAVMFVGSKYFAYVKDQDSRSTFTLDSNIVKSMKGLIDSLSIVVAQYFFTFDKLNNSYCIFNFCFGAEGANNYPQFHDIVLATSQYLEGS